MAYNILNCAGFEETAGWMASGGCMASRLGLVLLFFLLAIIRKWGAEEWGIGFNFVFSLLGGLLVYFLFVTITGNFKIAMVLGLGAGLIVGYGVGYFIGGDD